MTNFILTSAISMAVLLGLYYLLLEREKMHRFNRFYLLTALVFSLALPFISITIPEYMEVSGLEPVVVYETAPTAAELKDETLPAIPQAQETVGPEVTEANYWPYIAWGIYGLATFTLGIRFFWNIRRFYIMKSKNATISYKGATLVLLDENVLPYTFLSTIFVNRKDHENRHIEPELFTHELTHVQQYHTLDILFIELLRTVFWFNPLLFLYKRAIRLNHEFLADETTIKEHRNIPVYQQLLLGKSGPASMHSLASSINFGITKKRFIMMTKTTNKTKNALLKLAVLPAFAALLFTLSVQTVIYAKNVDGKTMPPFVKKEAHSMIPEIFDGETIAEEQSPTVTVRDSATARRDEYYRGVRVVIDDKSRNLYIDKPYEKLADEQKELYLAKAPEKNTPVAGVQKVDYDFYLSDKDAVFYIDDHKVNSDVIKNHKPEDFASYRSQHSFSDGIKLSQVFFYTSTYFEKNIRHAYDHYPDAIYKITVLDKALDYTESRKLADDIPDDGKTDAERSKERLKAERERQSYSYNEYVKESNRSTSPKFPLEKGDFHKYFADNFKMKDKIGDKQLFILMSINTDGSVSDVKVRDVEPEVEAEIKRVLEHSPRWIPAQENGHAVKMGYTVNYPEEGKY